MFGPPSSPPNPPKPGSRLTPAPLVSVEDEPDDPTRLMDRRSVAERAREHAAIFNSPTKILPRVRSGVLRSVGANLIAYTQKPSVNLVLLLLAGTLLVGLGFVLGTARKEPRQPTVSEVPAVDKAPIAVPVARTAALATASAPVAAIAVSSLPLAPQKEWGGAVRPSPGSSARGSAPDFALQPDRPPPTGEKSFVPPVRNPGF